jgi:hypothetical protein
MARDVGETFDTAASLSFDSPVRGSIRPVNDIDVFYFTLDDGQTATIETTASERVIAREAETDTILTLFDGQGNYITEDDDSGQGVLSTINYTNTTGLSATYYVVVSSYNNVYDSFGIGDQPTFNNEGNDTGNYGLLLT